MAVNWLTCSKWSVTLGQYNGWAIEGIQDWWAWETGSFAFNSWQDIPLDRFTLLCLDCFLMADIWFDECITLPQILSHLLSWAKINQPLFIIFNHYSSSAINTTCVTPQLPEICWFMVIFSEPVDCGLSLLDNLYRYIHCYTGKSLCSWPELFQSFKMLLSEPVQ